MWVTEAKPCPSLHLTLLYSYAFILLIPIRLTSGIRTKLAGKCWKNRGKVQERGSLFPLAHSSFSSFFMHEQPYLHKYTKVPSPFTSSSVLHLPHFYFPLKKVAARKRKIVSPRRTAGEELTYSLTHGYIIIIMNFSYGPFVSPFSPLLYSLFLQGTTY